MAFLSRKFNCGKCSRSFKSQKNFKKHCRSHGLNEFMCDKCGRGFHSNTSLKQHLNKCGYKPKIKDITKPKTPKKLNNTHLEFGISKTKKRKCQYCNREFNRTFNNRRHMATCSKKPSPLDMTFANNNTSDTNSVCQYCSKRLSSCKFLLRYKRIRKHKPTEPSTTQSQSTSHHSHPVIIHLVG